LFFEHASEVYDLKSDLRPSHITGWGERPDLYDRLAANISAQFMAEIGVWKGSSTIMMAKYLKSQGHGVIVAVDTFLGALEFWDRRLTNGVRDETRDLVWHHGFPSVYYTFLSNVVHSGTSDYVIPFPAPSKLASDYFFSKKLKFDMIHIDAGHEYEDVVDDIELWWRNIRPGGILLGDDYMDFWAGVKQAANEFSNKTGLQLFVDGTKWWVHKPAE
jgi:hypothetical protein